jgi:hypothetical protein
MAPDDESTPTSPSSEASEDLYDWPWNGDGKFKADDHLYPSKRLLTFSFCFPGTPHHLIARTLRPATCSLAVEGMQDVEETVVYPLSAVVQTVPSDGSILHSICQNSGHGAPSSAGDAVASGRSAADAGSGQSSHGTSNEGDLPPLKQSNSATRFQIPVRIEAWLSARSFMTFVDSLTCNRWNADHAFASRALFRLKGPEGMPKFKDIKALNTAMRMSYYLSILQYVMDIRGTDQHLRARLPRGWYAQGTNTDPIIPTKVELEERFRTKKSMRDAVGDYHLLPKITRAIKPCIQELTERRAVVNFAFEGQALVAEVE